MTLSAASANRLEHDRYKHKAIVLNKDFGLELYETHYRGLDPQIGRFIQHDPLSENFVWQSPYTSMDNNPVSKIDPDGSYSRFGAWWRNLAWDGNGTSQNQSGKDNGEWGVTYGQTDADGVTRTHYQVRGGRAQTLEQAANEYVDEQNKIAAALANGEITEWYDGTYRNADGRDINETMTGQDKAKAFLSDVGMASSASAPQLYATKIASAKNTAKLGKELFKFGGSAGRHMAEPSRAVPVQILELAIKGSKGVADPKGSRALMHSAEMIKNGKLYKLDVLYDKLTNTIWHFQYSPIKP